MKSIIKRFFALALSSLGMYIFLSTASYAQQGRGYLVPVGGGPVDKEFMVKFLSLSKVKENPKVLIIPHAAKKLDTYNEKTQAAFHSAGVKNIQVLDLTDLTKAAKVIEDSDVIWMSGGSQTLLRRTLEQANLADLIRRKHAKGTLIGGTSAGASVQTDVMMASSKRDPETKVLIPSLSYGLKLWPEVIIDQHFSERKRLERLEIAVKRHPKLLGIGIDESTGVVYSGGGRKFSVIGKGTVTVLKVIDPQADKDKIELTKIILKAGDEYDMDMMPSVADAQITEGKGAFEFSDYPYLEGKKIPVHYYRPQGDVTEMPVLFVMHGMLRNADVYRDNWVSLADKHKVLVIVPEFSNKDFPSSRSYNYGNLRTKGGDPVDEKYWSYSLIDPIFDHVVKITGSKAQQYDLFGHSAGSQFAHRFFIFKKDTKANRVVASNAGSYMMPTWDIAFPFGLKGTQVDKERLHKAFSKQLVVQLGENDNDPNHHQLPKAADAMKQGAHRLERGHFFFKTAKEVAQKEGVEFNWSIRTVPGVGHQNGKMALDAAEFLYGK